MKTITWNVNRNNKLNFNKLSFIKTLDCDIIFLQEVSLQNLNLLKNYFFEYHFFYAKEILFSFQRENTYFLVTLLKQSYFLEPKLTTISLKSEKTLLYRLLSREIQIEFLIVKSTTINGVEIELINCHLQYAVSPSVRLAQFNAIKQMISSKYFIIGGDLNTFSSPLISLFIGYLFNYTRQDFLAYESRNFMLHHQDLTFGNYKFQTSIYKSGKLDWVCCSHNIDIIHEEVLYKYRNKSDHYPVLSKLNLMKE